MIPTLTAFVLFSSAGFATGPWPQTAVLNQPFARSAVVGNVQDFRMHPAGGEVLFRADARHEGSFELYRVPLDGARAPQPVVALAAGRSVGQYEFTADGEWLVWRGEGERDDEVALFVHRVGVPLSTRVSPRAQGEVLWFVVQGSRLVYATRTQPSPAPVEALWSVPVDGSTVPVRLTPATGGFLREVAFAPLAPRFAFTWRDSANVLRLYSAALDGSAAPFELDVPGDEPFAWQQHLELTSDGARAVYSAFVAGDQRVRSVPLDGSSAPVELAGASGSVARSLIAPDGSRLVYQANELDADASELFSRPIAGGSALRISAPLTGTQQLELVAVHAERAYYLRTLGGTVPRLLSVPIAGGEPARQLATYGDTFGQIEFTADGQFAVYQTGTDGIGFFPEKLWSVPLDAAAPTVLLDDNAFDFELSPASTRVLFARNFEGGGVWVAPLDGSAPAVEVAPGGSDQDDIRLGFTPDGAGILVVIDAEPDVPGVQHLYRASASGPGRARLSTVLASGTFSDVDGFEVEASGARAVFTADSEFDNERELFAVPSDGSAPAAAFAGEGSTGQASLTSDGLRVVFVRDGGLWSAPSDGSAPPLAIHGPIAAGKQLASFLLTPDGTRALYHLAGSSSLAWELWSAPVAGGTAVLLDAAQHSDALPSADSRFAFYRVWDPVALTYRLRRAALDGSGQVELAAALLRTFVVSPDDERVLFTALPQGLFVVPADGSAPAVALEADLEVPDFLGRNGFRVTPDGTEVVYIAGVPDELVRALYAAPLDASAPPRLLLDSASSFFLSVDGARALCVAHDNSAAGKRLFSVRLDGSSAPVPLHAPFPTAFGFGFGGPSTDPFIASTPDGSVLLYVAAAEQANVLELYVVPPDGSAPPRKLNRALTLGGDVATSTATLPFTFTPDSTRVVYCADSEVDGVGELWLVPLDGSAAAVRLNPPLVAPGVLGDFALSGDGSRLLYRATRSPLVNELFSTKLPMIPQQRHAARR